MRGSKLVSGFGLAILGLVTSLLAPWWRFEQGHFAVSMYLRRGEMCFASECTATPRSPALGGITFGVALGALGVVVAVAGLAITGRAGRRALLAAGAASGAMLVMTLATCIVVGGAATLGMSWGLVGAVAGAGFGLATVFASKDDAPPEISVVTAARELEAAKVSVTPVAVRSAAAGYQQQINTAARSAGGAPPALSFVVRAGEVVDGGVTCDGRRIAWADLAAVFARRLPPDPPFEKMLIVDLIPSSGDPFRLVASTRFDFRSLPQGAGATMKDNLRRLIACARGANPKLASDPGTDVFASGGEAPMFGSMRQLAEHDHATRNRK